MSNAIQRIKQSKTFLDMQAELKQTIADRDARINDLHEQTLILNRELRLSKDRENEVRKVAMAATQRVCHLEGYLEAVEAQKPARMIQEDLVLPLGRTMHTLPRTDPSADMDTDWYLK